MTRIQHKIRLAAVARLSAALSLAAALSTAGLGTAQAASGTVNSRRLTLVSGTVLSPDGRPVGSDRVFLYPADSPADVSYPMIIGSARTNAQGKWSFAVPAWAGLPVDSQAAANGNGGWLNVIASAFGVAGSFEEEADGVTAVWTGTKASSVPPAGTAAPGALTMIMAPDQKDISSMASARGAAGTWAGRASIMSTAEAYAKPPTDKYGYQSAVSPDPEPGYSPYVAPGGVNLASVPVAAGVSRRLPKKCRTDDGDWKVRVKTVHKGWAWTKMGEYHTNWKATGGFEYTIGANTSISVEVSADGLHFHADHSKTYHNDSSDTLGVDKGPYDSHQVVMSVNYREKARIDFPCKNPGTTTCYPNVICAAHYWVEETGLRNPGNGWVFIKLGANVHKYDGYLAFEEDAIDKYWNGFKPGSTITVTTGHGVDYKYGASVGLGPITVSIESETDHSTDAAQSISFERGRRLDLVRNKHTNLHEVWGFNHKLTNIPGPSVFYNY